MDVRSSEAPTGLSVCVRQDGDATVVHIRGEVDLFCLPTVRTAVGRPGTPTLTVDLGDVTFIDAAGVEYLLELSQTVQLEGAVFRIAQTSPRVRRVIELLGLEAQLR